MSTRTLFDSRPDGLIDGERRMLAAHARPLTRWVLVDRVRAEQWLLAHSDRPDAQEGGQ